MILKDFAIKHKLNTDEVFEVLFLENFLIETIEDELDETMINFLTDFFGIKDKKKKPFKGSSFKRFEKKNNLDKEKEKIIEIKETSVLDLSEFSNISAAKIISFFLKQKKLYSINTVLSKEEVKTFCDENNLKQKEEKKEKLVSREKFDGIGEKRNPVVVIVGHVDHGKTSLLDTIRETTIAKNEKGGITQKIGAYLSSFGDKNIVFIDTPGHEAFTLLRSRGIKVADIAILIISAEEGVKAQTIESINMINSIDITPLVVITKIDRLKSEKDKESAFNKIYKQLAEQNINVEEWGGNTPVVKVSIHEKDTIKNLLNTLIFMSDLMDLKTNFDANPVGLILESKIEKGRGPVATIILQQGKINLSEYFYTKNILGRVSYIEDDKGKSLKSVKAYEPFVLSGFDKIPEAGSMIFFTSLKDAKKKIEEFEINFSKTKKESFLIREESSKNVILKADSYSSLESLVNLITKTNGKNDYDAKIVSSSVGKINEKDIDLALITKSLIYSFGLKIDQDSLNYAKKLGVEIKNFDIIYHLIEDLELFLKKIEEKIEFKKIGEILVLKVFEIKNIGIIAGFKVLNGTVKKGNKAFIYRDKKKIGEGFVKSLQKEREFVKELTKGEEGAFSIEGFQNWKENDFVEINSH